mmetsp:Transcript_23929/g.59373  ORF Transcript_23929/g.59373 Transcript_23929/m.59373 type:complete len:123 (-) Transcript_23929:35-403(-)
MHAPGKYHPRNVPISAPSSAQSVPWSNLSTCQRVIGRADPSLAKNYEVDAGSQQLPLRENSSGPNWVAMPSAVSNKPHARLRLAVRPPLVCCHSLSTARKPLQQTLCRQLLHGRLESAPQAS